MRNAGRQMAFGCRSPPDAAERKRLSAGGACYLSGVIRLLNYMIATTFGSSLSAL